MRTGPDIEQRMKTLGRELPEVMDVFGRLQEAVTAEGVLDGETKRLDMVGIAVSQRCEQCIRVHVTAALGLGASRTETLEAASAAVLMGGGPEAATTATMVLDLLDELGT